MIRPRIVPNANGLPLTNEQIAFVRGLITAALTGAGLSTEPVRPPNTSFLRWLRTRCEPAPDAQTKAKSLLDDYKAWCVANGVDRPMGATGFGRALSEHGVHPFKYNGTIWRAGIALKSATFDAYESGKIGMGSSESACASSKTSSTSFSVSSPFSTSSSISLPTAASDHVGMSDRSMSHDFANFLSAPATAGNGGRP